MFLVFAFWNFIRANFEMLPAFIAATVMGLAAAALIMLHFSLRQQLMFSPLLVLLFILQSNPQPAYGVFFVIIFATGILALVRLTISLANSINRL